MLSTILNCGVTVLLSAIKSALMKRRTLFEFIFVCCCAVLALNFLLEYQLGDIDDKLALDDHVHSEVSVFSRMKKTITIDNSVTSADNTNPKCTYWKCVDVYRCSEREDGRISVYVYDIYQYSLSGSSNLPPPSKEFLDLLVAIVKSPYFTADPNQACLLVVPLDLLNRESVNGETVSRILSMLPHWNNGSNHLLFNMLPGTAPDYSTTLDFPHGHAIVAGAGFSQQTYRRTFDVSIPFYNPIPEDSHFLHSSNSNRQIFLISSQTSGASPTVRAIIANLAKQRDDVLILSKCTEGGSYHERCDGKDRRRQYPLILTDSTFCLITKSRRFAGTTLHDVMRAGCVPVIAMDSYVMPFSEVLDWKRAAIFINEQNLPMTLDILSNVANDHQLLTSMQEQIRFFYQHYFSSMEAIAITTLDIINDRVFHYRSKSYNHWNRPPVPNLPSNPFFVPLRPSDTQGFTAVVLTYNRVDLMLQVVANLAKARSLTKIIVVWNNVDMEPPSNLPWPKLDVPIKVIQTKRNVLSNRFYPYKEIETDCVLNIDDDITMVTPEDLEFGYHAWLEFPDHLVGFPPRVHSFNNSSWKYESEWMSNISMVLTGVAFYHKYYNYLYTSSLPSGIKQWVDDNMNCEDIAMNFLISNATGKAPIKLLARKKFKVSVTNLSNQILSHLVARNVCMMKFVDAFGLLPLRTVEFRADPVLYKEDNVPELLKLFKSDGSL